MIEVRALTSDDWTVWRELRLAALTEAPDAFGSRLEDWQGDGDRADRWRARLEIPGGYNVVAVADGEPVGMASGLPSSRGGVELTSMWVRPSARGRGVGDLLVHAVERWARQNGARALRLGVMTGNRPAIALYQRHGFVEAPEADGRGDEAAAEQSMIKQLDPSDAD